MEINRHQLAYEVVGEMDVLDYVSKMTRDDARERIYLMADAKLKQRTGEYKLTADVIHSVAKLVASYFMSEVIRCYVPLMSREHIHRVLADLSVFAPSEHI